MPFPGTWEILEPFLRGAARCPKAAPFQKGSRIFNMATSYYNISLDHLADGCCVISRHGVLSSSCLFLTVPPSCRIVVQAGCCLASRHAAVSSSRHAALSSSHRPLTVSPSHRLIMPSGCCIASPSSCPLAILSLRHPLVVLSRLVVVLPLIAPPSRPLVASPSRPLIARRLVVAWPPSNDAATNEKPPCLCCRYRCSRCRRRHRRHRC